MTALQFPFISSLAGPYVNAYLTHDGKRYAKWKSSVQYDTALPVFNEEFQFNITQMDLNLIKITLHIKEYHRFEDTRQYIASENPNAMQQLMQALHELCNVGGI